MAHIIGTTGGNNVSNDYVLYVPMIDRILNGTYDWRNFFRDTFVVHSHSLVVTTLVRLAIVELTNWSVYAEMYVGLAAAILSLALLYGALARFSKHPSRLVLLPVLAALSFSSSQVDDFTYGDTALTILFNRLGLAIGIWALVKFRGRSTGVLVMVVGGIIGTLSGGGGLPVWPVFLFGMVALGYRRRLHYLVWLAGAAIAISPYFYFGFVHPAAWTGLYDIVPYPHPHLHSPFNLLYFAEAIGWPFAQGFSGGTAALSGTAGLVIGLVASFLLWTRRTAPWISETVPGLMLILYGLLSIWMAMVVRGFFDPWYAAHFVTLWMGLVGIGFVLWVHRGSSRCIRAWILLSAEVVALLYGTSNLTYADKVMFMKTRTPVSASCLRNYQTAPVYCQLYVFNWGISPPQFFNKFAEPLQRHHLSVFSPSQEWSLQGDFVLNSVHLAHAGTGDAFWSLDTAPKSQPWSDFRHLNLFLRSGNSIMWTLRLPANTTHAVFRSAIAAPSGAREPAPGSVTVLEPGSVRTQVVRKAYSRSGKGWQPFELSLDMYAGRVITLRLNAAPTSPSAWTVYRYPTIDIQIDPRKPDSARVGRPFEPTPTAHDARFDLTNFHPWQIRHLRPFQGNRTTWLFGKRQGSITYARTNLCLGGYSYLYFHAAAYTRVIARGLVIKLSLVESNPHRAWKTSIIMPLYADGRVHPYSYDLKLLELPSHTRLAGLRLLPLGQPVMKAQDWILINDLRLIRPTGGEACP